MKQIFYFHSLFLIQKKKMKKYKILSKNTYIYIATKVIIYIIVIIIIIFVVSIDK